MLTFTSLGGLSVRLSGPEKTIVAFPTKIQQDDKFLYLLATPEQYRTPGSLSWPGEYDVSGISIRGISHDEGRQTSYVLRVDGVRIAFLSEPLQDWTDDQLEMVGDIDVLVMPAGEVKVAQKMVDQIDPRILMVIPTDSPDTADVLKAVGAKGESVSEFKIKGSLPAEGREVIVLTK